MTVNSDGNALVIGKFDVNSVVSYYDFASDTWTAPVVDDATPDNLPFLCRPAAVLAGYPHAR